MSRLLLVIVLALGGSVAQADNGSFYFGAGITSNKLHDIALQGNDFPNIDSTSWKAFIGFRPIRLFAVEADYLDLGSSPTVEGDCTFCCMVACRGTHRSDSEAFVAYALGFLPIPVPFLDIYGKAGLARWKLNGSEFASVVFSDSGTDFAWGVGLQAHISMFGARLEYETFHIPNTSGATVASLSVFLTLF
jgi:Outer membrane protein beta-barrel domain